MPVDIRYRRVCQLGLTSLAVLALASVLTGCSAADSSGTTPGSASSSASSSATTTASAPKQTLTFDLAASRAGRPRNAPETALVAAWFPPDATLTTGLRQLTDKKQIAALTAAASANGQFWIELANNHAAPVVFGSEATSILATSTGFATALIVPVRGVAAQTRGGDTPELASDLKGKPAGYQVLLSGDVGETSFGLRPGGKPGEWLLDPNGELVNWGNAIDAVGRNPSFVAQQAFVTHTTFDLGGRPALYLSWAVFRSPKGQEYAVALHSPPAVNAVWTIGDNKPLRLGTAYDPATIYGPVVATQAK